MENESIRTKIQNMNKELDLNQRTYLLDAILKFDRNLWNNEEAKDKIFENTRFMTEGKYRYLLHLFFASKDSNHDTRFVARSKFEREIEQLINL